MLVTLGFTSLGCSRAERTAQEHLEAQGLLDIELEELNTPGNFSYTCSFGDDACVGRINVVHQGTNTSIRDQISCRPREENCNAETPGVCWRLGKIHEEGDTDEMDPTPVDHGKAAALYRKGCDLGHHKSCNALGVLHVDGRGVGKSHRDANALFDRACSGGSMRGCYNVALSHHHGHGRPADPSAAQPLYEKACAANVASACYNLGVCARDAVGRKREHPLARSSFLKACRKRHLDACLNLGVLVTLAEHIPAEPDLARVAFRRACDGGVADGCTALQKLEAAE